MASAWQRLGIRVTIPGADIFSRAPAMPAVVNRSGGAFTDAQAHSIETAFWRESVLLQWAMAHGEPQFMTQTLLGPQEMDWLFQPSAQTALYVDGGSVMDPNCDIYPTSVTLWPHTSSVDAWIAGAQFQTSAPMVLAVPFNEAGCELTILDKGQTTMTPADPTHLNGTNKSLLVGEVIQDPTVGPFFRQEAGTNCDRPPADPQICD